MNCNSNCLSNLGGGNWWIIILILILFCGNGFNGCGGCNSNGCC